MFGVLVFALIAWLFFSWIITFLWLAIRKNIQKKQQILYMRKQYHSQRNKPIQVFHDCLFGLELHRIKTIGMFPSQRLRKVFYWLCGMQMGKKVVIYGGCEFRDIFRVQVGQGTIIGNNCSIDGRNGVIIGKNVNMSTGVQIWTEQHDTQSRNFSCDVMRYKMVKIEDRVWLSNNSIILPGVTIGEGSVVAAGSVVTKDVEPFSIYAGIPAKKIGNREKSINYEFKGNYLWFI